MAGLTQTRIRDLVLFNPETNSTPIDQLYLVVDHSSFAEPLKILFPVSAAESDVLLGSNLVSSSGWTSTGWTGDSSIGWTHTAGNTNALSNTLAAIINSNYQLQLTVTGRTAGSFIVEFGGDTSPSFNSSSYYTILATTNGNLVITPTSDFDGTILIAIKEVVWQITEQEILDILGVTSVASEEWVTSGFVAKVTGKSLIDDSEITRLSSVKQNVYTIYLNASSDVATRLSGLVEGTDYPTGWTLSADSAVNLLITHTLTGRKLASVNIFETDGSNERLAKPFSDAYSGVLNGSTTVLIEGLDTLAVDLRIELFFN